MRDLRTNLDQWSGERLANTQLRERLQAFVDAEEERIASEEKVLEETEKESNRLVQKCLEMLRSLTRGNGHTKKALEEAGCSPEELQAASEMKRFSGRGI